MRDSGTAAGRLWALSVDELLTSLEGARLFDLEQPRRAGDPVFPAHAPGFLYWLHRRHEPGLGEARTSASGTVVMAEHSGTHIDALCHQAEGMRLFGNVAIDASMQTSSGFTTLDAGSLDPIIGRGVLLDIAGGAGAAVLDDGYEVASTDLEEAARVQNTEVRKGDVVLVRTGNGSRWSEPEEYVRGPGIGADARLDGWPSAIQRRWVATTSRGTSAEREMRISARCRAISSSSCVPASSSSRTCSSRSWRYSEPTSSRSSAPR